MTQKAPTPDSLYENRLVAFIDVLGWGELVRRSVVEPNLIPTIDYAAFLLSRGSGQAKQSNARARLFDEVLGREPSKPDLRASHFSDSYVITAPEGQQHAFQLAELASDLFFNMLKLGHYVRGAIVLGPIHHSVDVLYGPALVEAYRIEQSVAKYPRIIVSPEVQRVFDQCPLIRTDFDGLSFVDVLLRYVSMPGVHDADLAKVREIVEAKLSDDAARLDFVQKHRWFLNYFEQSKRDGARRFDEWANGRPNGSTT